MKQVVLLALALLLSVAGWAQEFRVLAARGAVEVIKDGANTRTTAGMSLVKGQTLVLQPNSYVGLVHQSGTTLELKTPGTYHVADLAAKAASQQKQSLASRYASYVLAEITDKTGNSELNRNYRKYMSTTGSVERAITGVPADFDLHTPVRTHIMPGAYPISWEAYPNAKKYAVVITDRFDEPVVTTPTPGTAGRLDLTKLKDPAGQVLFYHVQVQDSVNRKSSRHMVQLLPEEDQKRLAEEMQLLASEQGAIARLMEGAFLEENFLYLQALQAYQKAVELEPEVPEYQTLLSAFRQRIGLEK